MKEKFINVALSQLGYKESTLNFQIAENGDVFGYTRYGQYYQDIYAEWNHLFVGFCIDYSNIAGYKFDADLVADNPGMEILYFRRMEKLKAMVNAYSEGIDASFMEYILEEVYPDIFE